MISAGNITSESILTPYRGGIKLLRSSEFNGTRLSAVYDSSIATYFMTAESRNVIVNEATAALNGANSASDLIGLGAHELWHREAANKQQADDKRVMQNETIEITDDSAIRMADEAHIQMITLKMPWYDNDKMIGIFGMTLKLDFHALSEFTTNLTTIITSGIVNSNQLSHIQTLIQPEEDKVYLSKRETDILKLLVRSLSAKQIADRLCLSKRTVENYLANIKMKTNCHSRYELIERYYSRFRGD